MGNANKKEADSEEHTPVSIPTHASQDYSHSHKPSLASSYRGQRMSSSHRHMNSLANSKKIFVYYEGEK